MTDARYQHLLDLLGARDHEDAARIIAGYHAREMQQPSAQDVSAGVEAIIAADEAAWALARRAEEAGAEREESDNDLWWTLGIEQFKAIAQQPPLYAAPTLRPITDADVETAISQCDEYVDNHAGGSPDRLSIAGWHDMLRRVLDRLLPHGVPVPQRSR